MKKLFIGILVSIVFVYFSFRGVEFDKVLTSFKNSKYFFLIPAIVLFLLASLLRSLRWEVILFPLVKISQKRLFPIFCVGQMGATLFPMRIGEFVRAYLVNVESKIPISTALATTLMEKLFDLLTILSILFFITFNSTLPGWLVKIGYVSMPAFAVLLFLVLCLNFRPEFAIKLSGPFLRIFPKELQLRLENIIHRFADGFKIISSPKRLFYILVLSFSIWGCFGLGIYSLFFFSNFQLTMFDALIVLVCTILGISIPAAPGMVGNFHYASIVALLILNVPKDEALMFSMIFYFLVIGRNILLGLIYMPWVNLSFKDVRKRFDLWRKLDHS
jgi:uncharacterized protein (TIRG00374 family)